MSNMIANALGNLASKALGVQGNQKTINDAMQLYNSLKGNGNYMQTLEAMSSTNPQIAQALDFIKQEGGDPKKAFYNLVSKSGIDASAILNMLK